MKYTPKHTQIMTAAAALFARYGYKKTTIDEIVKAADISKGLFYHYYKNKAELYLDIYDRYTNLLSDSVYKNIDLNETDLFIRLKQISHIRIDFISQYPGLWDFLYCAYFEKHPDIGPLIKDKNAALLRESRTRSAANIDWSRLKDGITPDKAIEIVTWIAEGFVQKIKSENLPFNSELYKEADSYIDLLKNGLLK